jgi:hypothetical protein
MSSWDKYNGLIRLPQRLTVRYQADATPVTAVSIFRFVPKILSCLIIAYGRGVHILKKYRSYLKILGPRGMA